MSRNPVSLKQRLSALAISPSAPSSPRRNDFGPGTPTPKRSTFFKPPWVRRNSSTQTPEQWEVDKVASVMSRLIYQAGVDYETRPMVVMNASALPDPKEVSYDLLLSRVLSYLNLYVEADYTVVFFAAGSRNTPGWNWVWKAYRSLSRTYRKNLKRLFIVHSNFFTKMLFSLAGAIISPKFFRKICYVDTLSELAFHIPLTQIDIPAAVYKENLRFEQEIKMPVAARADLFGVPLDELMGFDGEKGGLPRVVRDCIQFLRESGLQDEGLFRRSPSSVLLKQVQEAYDRGQVVSLETFGDPHLAAVLLKKYLRDLPEPLFSEDLYSIIRRCPPPTTDPGDVSSVQYIRESILPELPPCFYILLSAVLHLMHEVSLRSATNRMDAHNLTVVLCPNLIKGTNPIRDVQMCAIPNVAPPPPPSSAQHNQAALTEGRSTLGGVIKLCIQRYYEVFDEVVDRTEAIPDPPSRGADDPPSSSGSSSASLSEEYEEEEDLDDAMLVMPIGPDSPKTPPSAWAAANGASANMYATYKARHKSSRSKGSAMSMFTTTPTVNGVGSPTVGKARSTISIEKGSGHTVKKGSIAIGRGTMRGKASASGVEAMGITASGFFAPPAPTRPPMPTLPSSRLDDS